jgi:hypothetical protein
MPRTVYSIKAEIRDHAMTIPVPENTLAHAIPNACNVCHKDRDANWALEKMSAWYGSASRQKLIRRADAFTDARKGDAGAVPKLLAILNEPKEGALVRANAVGYLGNFQSDPAVVRALLQSLSDPEPLVRALAIRALNPGQAYRSEATLRRSCASAPPWDSSAWVSGSRRASMSNRLRSPSSCSARALRSTPTMRNRIWRRDASICC